ncbi:MAG: hypothetical protein V4731_13920 [Pseudomonadota bacterium]
MVAIVAGRGLGLAGTSADALGSRGVVGTAGTGRGGDNVYVNAANGNLVVQRLDELVKTTGSDMGLLRTYNSKGVLSGANGDGDDNWRIGFKRQVTGLAGTANTAGSTVTRVDADGATQGYTYDSNSQKYISTDGAGSYDTLVFSAGQWTWQDGNSRVSEVYGWSGGTGKLLSSRDLDGNTITYTYHPVFAGC